ncbi:hypothetical protein [Streptomyces sp. NPDC046909]|uniref:nSTAND1 domain-containing NTPase n=1 Tax=Streptomyces sp. NPDC046909 TaxID=3155617 RepID=UPI0033D4EE81
MGRPEKALDPEAGPVQRLAHGLRELRKAAGQPSYRVMQAAAGYSASTLSDAAGGQRLPSLPVLQGYVRACGGDLAVWEARWEEARAAVSAMVRDETEDGAAPPYRGLARFEPDDRELFFGRDRLAAELEELVCDHRFAVVFGASGSGKSSLLRAGLVPRLREKIAERRRPAVLRILTPGPTPAASYGHLLSPADDEPESWVLVDQFEEVFTLCRDPQERTRFIDLLLRAQDRQHRLRVLIAVRADFYPRCAEHRELARALRGAGLLVGPMTSEELRETVVGPAQAAGLLVERELTARVVEEVMDQPGGLPMLSHALLETWRRRRSRLLTLEAYEAAGGVRGAIAASAEEVYGRLTSAQAEAARSLLLRLVEPGQGAADTRRPLSRTELAEWANPEVPAVLEKLAGARLLTVDEDAVQLAHEALIGSWPRLHGWLEEDREWLREHRRLTEAAHAWLEHDRDPGTLWRGLRLARAEELFTDGTEDHLLTWTEQAFLTAARDARATERRAAARSTRRVRTLIATLAAVLVVALVAGFVAVQQNHDNHRRSTEEAARRVAGVAYALQMTDPRTAQLLGVAAWQVAQLPDTRRALLGALNQPEQDTFVDPTPGDDPGRQLLADGRTLLSAAGHVWRTWDVVRHRRIASGRLPTDGKVEGASADGRLLAIDDGGKVRLWDTTTRRWRADRLPASAFVRFVGPDYVVSDSDDYKVEVRSVRNGRTLLRSEVENELLVAPGSDGRRTADCPLGGAPRIRDTATGRTVPGDWEKAGDICGSERSLLAFAGGRRLAAVGYDGIRVWDVRSGRQVAELGDPGVRFASFSPDENFLATADAEEIRVWRIGVDKPVFRHPLNNQPVYGRLSWDPGGTVLRYTEGVSVHSLDVSRAVTPDWRSTPADAGVLAPDGHTLATARRTGDTYRVEVRDTRSGGAWHVLPAPPLPVAHSPSPPVSPEQTYPLLAFAPDGGSLVYGVSAPGAEISPQRLTVWDVHKGRTRTTLDLSGGGPAGSVLSIAPGPDGRTLHLDRVEADGSLIAEEWSVSGHRRTAGPTAVDNADLAVRPDGELLVADSHVTDLRTRKATVRGLVQGDEIGAVAFAPDGSLLVAGDHAGRVTLWDGDVRRRKGVLWNVFPAPPRGTADGNAADGMESVSALAVSPDDRTLAVAGDAGSVQLWDIATQQPLGGALTTPGEEIDSLAFSRDGGTLYASSAHVPLQRYTVAPSRAVEAVCARTGGAGLTPEQWHTYVTGAPYRKVCG